MKTVIEELGGCLFLILLGGILLRLMTEFYHLAGTL